MANSIEENRRRFIKSAIGTASALVLAKMAPAWAYPLGRSYGDVIHAQNVVDLHIRREDMNVAGRIARPITINGSMPGPLIRLKEGQRAKLHVSNALDESTSIHWHGIILPENMDGVPGVSFPGIKAGESYKNLTTLIQEVQNMQTLNT